MNPPSIVTAKAMVNFCRPPAIAVQCEQGLRGVLSEVVYTVHVPVCLCCMAVTASGSVVDVATGVISSRLSLLPVSTFTCHHHATVSSDARCMAHAQQQVSYCLIHHVVHNVFGLPHRFLNTSLLLLPHFTLIIHFSGAPNG